MAVLKFGVYYKYSFYILSSYKGNKNMIRLNSSFPYQKQLKNRSSKHLKWFTGVGCKSPLRCCNNETLQRWVAVELPGAAKEQARRRAKHK